MTDVNDTIQKIEDATSDEEALAAEAEAIQQTDNRPQDGDPTQPEEAE